jgi:osomolarity two-component system response regulator SSK1
MRDTYIHSTYWYYPISANLFPPCYPVCALGRRLKAAAALAFLAPPSPSSPSSNKDKDTRAPRFPSPDNVRSVTMQRRIWVKRPGASATRVAVQEDDLVDNVRDVILHKYANSLGRSIDSPDINLKIVSREPTNNAVKTERVLGPEEPIGQTLDTYYPGGQDIEEALVIEIPQRRTPRPSPLVDNHAVPYYISEVRPGEGAREYFPPMAALQSPHLAGHAAHSNDPRHPSVHSIAVLNTGQLPPLPSPGAHMRRSVRPRMGRQHTSSPTILHTVQPSGTTGQRSLKIPENGY